MTAANQREVKFWKRLEASVTMLGAGGLLFTHKFGEVHIVAGDGASRALLRMSEAPLSEDDIASLVAGDLPYYHMDVLKGLYELKFALDLLSCAVVYGVESESEQLLKLEPLSNNARPPLLHENGWSDATLTLSRFAHLRRPLSGNALALESPLSLYRGILSTRLLCMLSEIAQGPVFYVNLEPANRLAARLLCSVGLLSTEAEAEAENKKLATWCFHDLLFHGRSRPGRSDEPVGAHFRHRETMAPLPAVGSSGHGQPIPLFRPAFASTVAKDRTLTEVLESRKSYRQGDAHPISVEQVGELLYRAARVRRLVNVQSIGEYEGSDRVYPTGGLVGDLEIYLSISSCAGLEAGIYHYRPDTHALVLVAPWKHAAPLAEGAQVAQGNSETPQILLTFTSRFGRVSWKYESIAYSLVLKHVGILMQTIYLVATSMELAVCALGTGDAGASALAFGKDWLVESSVGEMTIGRRKEASEWTTSFFDVVDGRNG